MKYLIMGAGAVGGYYGGLMTKAGIDVTLISRGQHLVAMQKNGLMVHSINGDFRVPVKAFSDPQMADMPDVVLFTTKANATFDAARELRPAINENTLVISLQNGVGNVDVLKNILYPDNIMPGVVYIGASREPNGVIRHTALGKIIIGREDGKNGEREANIVQELSSAGIEVALSDNINFECWKKLVWNAAFNGVTALTQTTIGEAASHVALHDLLVGAMREVVLIARKAGYPVKEDVIEKHMANSRPFTRTSTSMKSDVERGTPLEVDAIHGGVVSLGQKYGVKTPINSMLYACLSVLNERLERRRPTVGT